MTPQNFGKLLALILAASISVEAALLSGLFTLNDTLYHGQHLALMALLVSAQLLLWRQLRAQGNPASLAALLFGLGAASTALGDYINSAISGVEPVSLKLTWALLLFGIGYTLYVSVLWRFSSVRLQESGSGLYRWRYAVLLLIMPVNVLAWSTDVAALVRDHALLYYGSFVFNATIYVMMPGFALWYLVASRWSLGAIIVLIGAVWIPFSDLVLFAAWLPGNPAVPSRELYAYNWLLYFGGQVLIAFFPSLVASTPREK
jgi:hypothetical protein